MVFFTLFIVLPTEEVCTLRGVPSGVTVNEIKSRLEVSAGLPSQIYHLSSRRHQELDDDYILELHHNVWNGFQYRAEVKASWRPLFAAVVKEDIDWLLRNGRVCVTPGDNNNNNNGGMDIRERGSVALYLASWLGSSKISQSLLSAGVSPNGATRNNRTPLFAAVARDNAQVVSILLNHGTKLYVKDINGDTPLDTARRNAAKQCLKIILSARSTSVYNLKAGDKDLSAETDISLSKFAREVGHENIASVEYPKKRPFTSQERPTIGCDYKVKFKPSMSASRRSVRFNVEKVHSVFSSSNSTLLPDVLVPTYNKGLPSSKCVSFRAHKPHGTRIPELSLLTVKPLLNSAPGESWNKIKDAAIWNDPTKALECFHVRSVLGKQKSNARFGHSDNDLHTAVGTERSYVAENEELGTDAFNPEIAYDEQSYNAADLDFNTHAHSCRIAQYEKSGVTKKTDIDTSALNPTTTQHEQSVEAKDVDFRTSGSDLATAESEQSGVNQKVDRGACQNLKTVENEQSDGVEKIDLGTPASNRSTAQYAENGNVEDSDFNTLALNHILPVSEQNKCAKKIYCCALPKNITIAETEQSEDAKEINPSSVPRNITTNEQSHDARTKECDTSSTNLTSQATNFTTAEQSHDARTRECGTSSPNLTSEATNFTTNEQSHDARTKECDTSSPKLTSEATNFTNAEQSHDAKTRECGTSSPKLTSEATNSAAVPLCTDTNVPNADVIEGSVGSASNVREGSKTIISCNSVKDSRPMTTNVSIFRNQNPKSKSAGAQKTAVRQIKLAEQRKRIMSASGRNK
ncbi:hypothetical protein BsWGS_15738 [Bradybaena similaris]